MWNQVGIPYTVAVVPSSSVQLSHSVVADSLRPHGLQRARLPCPSPASGVCSTSCPSSQWCHPTISSSVVPFSSCLQSFPATGKRNLLLQHELFQGVRDQGCGIRIGVESSFSSHLVLFSGEWGHLPEEYDMTMIWAMLCVCVSCSIVSDSLRPHGLSMEFSRQAYWSGLPFLSPGDQHS